MIVRLSRETGIPLVATNDAHYLTKQDAKMQRVLICIQTNKSVYDDDVLEFGTRSSMSKARMRCMSCFLRGRMLVKIPIKSRKWCQFDFEFGVTKLPSFEVPDGMDNRQYFEKLCREGLERHYKDAITPEIEKRLA